MNNELSQGQTPMEQTVSRMVGGADTFQLSPSLQKRVQLLEKQIAILTREKQETRRKLDSLIKELRPTGIPHKGGIDDAYQFRLHRDIGEAHTYLPNTVQHNYREPNVTDSTRIRSAMLVDSVNQRLYWLRRTETADPGNVYPNLYKNIGDVSHDSTRKN
jgi:hypothetical protein